MNVSYFYAVIIIILILFMLMIWFMFRGLRKVLIGDVQEAIITVGEDIGARVDNVQRVIVARIKALADVMNSITLQTQSPESMEKIFSVIHELQNETDNFLKDFAAKVEKSSQINNKTLALFDDEIKKFTRTITESIKNLQEASRYVTASVSEIRKTTEQNNKMLADMATNFQGVLYKSSGDIRDAFAKTDDDLKALITDSMAKIREDYEKNMSQLFQAMADNLASIIKEVS